MIQCRRNPAQGAAGSNPEIGRRARRSVMRIPAAGIGGGMSLWFWEPARANRAAMSPAFSCKGPMPADAGRTQVKWMTVKTTHTYGSASARRLYPKSGAGTLVLQLCSPHPQGKRGMLPLQGSTPAETTLISKFTCRSHASWYLCVGVGSPESHLL